MEMKDFSAHLYIATQMIRASLMSKSICYPTRRATTGLVSFGFYHRVSMNNSQSNKETEWKLFFQQTTIKLNDLKHVIMYIDKTLKNVFLVSTSDKIYILLVTCFDLGQDGSFFRPRRDKNVKQPQKNERSCTAAH